MKQFTLILLISSYEIVFKTSVDFVRLPNNKGLTLNYADQNHPIWIILFEGQIYLGNTISLNSKLFIEVHFIFELYILLEICI